MNFSSSMDTPLVAEGTQENPVIPESRIRDGWHANSIFRKLEFDDSGAEQTRANIDFQIDGGLPYSPDVMKDAGRGEDANVNFREAKAEDDLAQTPFIEMGTVSPILWRIKTNFGNPGDQRNYSAIISEEFSKTVRDWGEDFDYYRQRLAQQFTRHGAGFAYFEDEFNWQWRADGLSAFKVPRRTESRSSAISYCTCSREMTTDQLYKFIKNEDVAREVGRWNVDAVKRAILTSSGRNRDYSYQWEDFVRESKENDLDQGSAADTIKVYHLWVREYDGQVSHYIGLQDGVAMRESIVAYTKENKDYKSDMIGNGFLYAHRFRFPSFGSCVLPFFYAIGTHATIHTIRGQGEMNFGPISIANRTRCTQVDATRSSSMILMRAETPSDVENFAYIQMGGFMVYSGGNSKVEPTAMPDVSARVQPLLNEMSSLRKQLLPMSTTQGVPTQGKSKQPDTKYGIQALQNRGGSLSSAMLTQWFGPFGRLGKEMYRRMVNPKLSETDPGGKEAFQFRLRCMKRGVPTEAMDFDRCEVGAVRVIGNGSPEARQYAAEQVWELADAFDEPGRKQALLDVVGSIPGVDWQSAEDYVGPTDPRQPIDQQIANGENSLFTLGGNAKVTGEQDHWVHCQVHEELVKQFVDSFNQGQIDGQKLVTVIKPALDNMLAHSEFLTKDKTREKESASVRKFIQQNNGILEQQENKLIAAMQRQQQATQGGQQGGQPSGEEQRKSELHQAKLAEMQQEAQNRQLEFNQRLASMSQEARTKQALADLEAAHRIAEKTASLAAESV